MEVRRWLFWTLCWSFPATKNNTLRKEKSTENLNNTVSEVKITIDESLLGDATPKHEDKALSKNPVNTHVVRDLLDVLGAGRGVPPEGTYQQYKVGAAGPKALSSSTNHLEENIKNLKVNCDSLAFAKARKDSKFEILMMQLDYTLKDRQTAAEEEKMMETPKQIHLNQLLAEKEQKLNLVTAEIEACKRKIQELQKDLQEKEYILMQQVTAQYRKCQESWYTAMALEWELAWYNREVVKHSECRLDMKQSQEEYKRQNPALGRPGWQNQTWRVAGAHAGPMRSSGSGPAEDSQKTKVNMESPRHPPFRGMRCYKNTPKLVKNRRLRLKFQSTLETLYELPEPS